MRAHTVVATALSAAAASTASDVAARDDLAYSPPFYPSPWMSPQAQGWEESYARAAEFVSQLTLAEKVNLTTGIGWQSAQCVSQTKPPRHATAGKRIADSAWV